MPEARPKVIFLGNGPLAEAAEAVLETRFDLVFHARTKEDLETVRALKAAQPGLHAVLASYGQMIKQDLLDCFEPEGILNIHPSLLPKYRGPSPIETAILNGDTEFGVSVMKLVKKMDAGPIYFQATVRTGEGAGATKAAGREGAVIPLEKATIYRALAEAGACWLVENLENLPAPVPQDDAGASYTQKITKKMAVIDPAVETAEQVWRKVVAFQGFPKVRWTFYSRVCLILAAHTADSEGGKGAEAGSLSAGSAAAGRGGEAGGGSLSITCADGRRLVVDRLQPEGKRPMDARSFLNGYAR